ncbi:modulator of FtsH protease HflK [Clostridium tepidiprofundi DSM 19306]|uniref:Protein HflK n=1 Tax=Clostridium tepidiprofundi DSM 19306 TaxID=1121338 RepID=A0A151B6G1_9CLOT|nr:FtsH protease activity modulator HflK [Clostridium tepidiprofundi]KYH35531.1 modulator of FtsH protease HflK [Clostridium tepidiprofundi DSM 19306]
MKSTNFLGSTGLNNPLKTKLPKTKLPRTNTKSIISVFSMIIIAIFLLSGIYTIKTGEEAVILRFGKHVSSNSNAGLKWHIPIIDKVYKANMNEVHRLEFGFRTLSEGSTRKTPRYTSNTKESLMLTGDENLVNAETIIQYKIKDAKNYFFKVDDPVDTLKIISESIIRRSIASHTLDDVLTDNKLAIQQEIKDDLQKLVDKYKLGIAITAIQLQDVNPPQEVDAAFKDVASAREDKNSYINEANSYKNEVIPKARGNAAEMVNKAKAYKTQRIEEAKGDVANFVQILEKYKDGKTVTKTRMYLEVLEEILPNMDKYILSEDGNTLNILNLNNKLNLSSKEDK